MPSPLIQHMQQYIPVTTAQEAIIDSHFTVRDFPKKTRIFSEGQFNPPLCFVISGCLRLFCIDEKGREQITHFSIENWWLTDFLAFGTQQKTIFCMETVADSILSTISYEHLEALSKAFPEVNHYLRINLHRALGAAQRRVKLKYTLSKEERFFNFADNYPEFVQRVPQYMLASFLGLTPEYLSELRRKRKDGR